MIQLHNTLSGKKEVFKPQDPSTVTIYTCGPTVYNEPHVGNWVAFLRWDILVRTLKASGYTVKRVMNITDVGHLTSDADEGEDKMQKGARREGISEWEVAERYTNRFLEGMSALNMLPPEHVTKATEHIDLQIDLVKQLEAKGFTYVLSDGVYFDTARFPTYADFAHLDLAGLRAGARVAQTEGKKNPSDFVLWRLTPAGEARTMEWDSPWGKGQPGWHIECSAMAMHYLGATLDIHTGGIDHIPVHHSNEIAQSEAASSQQFANYWLHANFLLSNGTKISKSLDNGYTLSDIAHHGFSALDFRMFILQSHYRSETNFTWDNLGAAHQRLKKWKDIVCIRHQVKNAPNTEDLSDKSQDIESTISTATHAALKALSDDLTTPEALVVIETALDVIAQAPLAALRREVVNQFVESVDDLLGLGLAHATPDIDDEAKQVLQAREHVRHNNDWARSDELRDKLAARGIGVNDSTDGSRWYWL